MSVINTNITALIGQNNLKGAQSSLQQAQERLSSGLRITVLLTTRRVKPLLTA